MPPLSRTSSFFWIIVLVGACGTAAWMHRARAHHITELAALVPVDVAPDPASPTGYAGGVRQYLAPEHNNDSYQWLAQTQQMAATGEWRVRHVSYDNAPAGREILSASPYRWWLAAVARLDRALSGQPFGIAVEHAALLADPLLHLLLLLGATVFAWRAFGPLPATLLSVGLITLFPFAAMYQPGQPSDEGLVHAAILGSLLLLLAGVRAPDGRARIRFFAVSAAAAALGLWLAPAKLLPVIASIGLGGLVVAGNMRRNPDAPEWARAWRAWGLAGAGATLAAYLAEFFPDHLAGSGWRLEAIHPLYGIAWLGLGEALAQATAGGSEANARRWPARARLLLALAVVAAVPILLFQTDGGPFPAARIAATHLSNLPGAPTAPNTLSWLARDGVGATATLTLLPVLALLPAGWLLVRRRRDVPEFSLLVLASAPVLATLGVALWQVRGWNTCDAALLALLVAVVAAWPADERAPKARALAGAGLALLVLPGLWLLRPPASGAPVTESDVVAFVERDLAHWLAGRKAGQNLVVLAPPALTASLYFHGGLSGLGTPYWENRDGFTAAVRIAGATSPDEAHAVAQARGLDYIVVPSWDGFLDEYAHIGSNQPDHALVALLHRWLPPRWLRPVPYQLPHIPGFEGQSVAIFQVVEVQDNATALTHLAEYFVEMNQLDQAALAAQALERLFPGDLSVALARAQVLRARGDKAGFARVLEEIRSLAAQGDDQLLAWDRRVALATVLAEARDFDTARNLVKQCVAEADADKLRSLTTTALYRLLAMGKAFTLPLPDPALRAEALRLLPAEMREGF